MPLYQPLDSEGIPLGPCIHAEGLEQADVLANQQYSARLQAVVLAPRPKKWDVSRKRALPPSNYGEIKMLASYGVFDTPEWQTAMHQAVMTEGQRKLIELQRNKRLLLRRHAIALRYAGGR